LAEQPSYTHRSNQPQMNPPPDAQTALKRVE